MSERSQLDIDVDAITRAAGEAARAWRDLGIRRRLEVLTEAGEALAARRIELDAGLFADGLSQALAAYYGDWIVHQGSAALLEFYARSLVRWVPTQAGGELFVRRPDGLVLLIPPANSPTINGSALFSLLLPGNAVITRAPPNDTGLRFLVEEIVNPALERAGIPAGLVPVITGKSRAILGAFAPRPEVKTIVFFGNATAGRAVAAAALEHDKKVVLELEGSGHMIVWKDARLGDAVDSALHAFDFSTQPCPIPKHLLVHADVFEPFMDRLISALPGVSATIEADRADGMLAPLARPEAYDHALEEVRRIGDVRAGGHRMAADGSRDPTGRYAAPTVVALEAEQVVGVPLRCFAEEIFFPLIPVVRFSGDDDAVLAAMLRVVGDSPFGLRASAWTESPAVLGRLTRAIGDVGLLLFNDDHAQAPRFAAPWGGPKRSGGPFGESHFFWEKTSHLQAIGCNRLTRAQIAAVVDALGALPVEGLP